MAQAMRQRPCLTEPFRIKRDIRLTLYFAKFIPFRLAMANESDPQLGDLLSKENFQQGR